MKNKKRLPPKEEDGISAYYDKKRKEAEALSIKLSQARARGATYEEIRKLERQLDYARYVGD